MEDDFSMDLGWETKGWFQDDSRASHLLCTLFPLLLHQLHLRSLGVFRSWGLGTPGIGSLHSVLRLGVRK